MMLVKCYIWIQKKTRILLASNCLEQTMHECYNLCVLIGSLHGKVLACEVHVKNFVAICSGKSVLGRVHNSCMLVLCLCCAMVVSQHAVDTRQMLYKYVIL